jgi:hypothetical protein
MSNVIIDERSGDSVQERTGHEPAPSRDPNFRTLQEPVRPPPGSSPLGEGTQIRRIPRRGIP